MIQGEMYRRGEDRREREREMGDAEKHPSLVWMGEVLSIQSDP